MNIWTTDYENLLDKIRLNSIIMSNHHKNKYYKYNKKLKWFRLPIIIISAFNSVFSVSLQNFTSQENISLINCGLSLIVGLLGSVELFLQIQKRCEIELQASKEFYLLSIDIYKMLKLESTHRPIDGKTYLEDKYNDYCKLFENSGLVHKKILDELQNINKSLNSNISNNSNITDNSNNSNNSNENINIENNLLKQNNNENYDVNNDVNNNENNDENYDENKDLFNFELSNKINELLIKKFNNNEDIKNQVKNQEKYNNEIIDKLLIDLEV